LGGFATLEEEKNWWRGDWVFLGRLAWQPKAVGRKRRGKKKTLIGTWFMPPIGLYKKEMHFI
jgi:hypothetical protein